jgi:hypothetical protein
VGEVVGSDDGEAAGVSLCPGSTDPEGSPADTVGAELGAPDVDADGGAVLPQAASNNEQMASRTMKRLGA